jgi:hypothetical protein
MRAKAGRLDAVRVEKHELLILGRRGGMIAHHGAIRVSASMLPSATISV